MLTLVVHRHPFLRPRFRTSPHPPSLSFFTEVDVWQAWLTANRILTTVVEPREQAGTLCRGSHLRGPQPVFLVRFGLTGAPCHRGRSRVSIRTPLFTVQVSLWSSQCAPSRPQVIVFVSSAVIDRCHLGLQRRPGLSANIAVHGPCGRCARFRGRTYVFRQYCGHY